ncbi:MAG TPA: NUDIX hydrolase [Terriglobia bacterium]|nr:NUDIX hydrolase [Terriglobia bacterium]
MKREFPKFPLVGVGGVVIHRERVLLIRRKHEPLKGEWSLPGGLVELGEELHQAVCRELKEETGLEVEPLEIMAVFDRIMRVPRNPTRVRYHFVIVDYACRWKCGRIFPSSDVMDARWVRPENLRQYNLTPLASAVISEAFKYFERERKPRRLAQRPFSLLEKTKGL